MRDSQKMRLTRHHLWWPRRAYRTELELEFRNLECNIVLLPDYLHQTLHKHQTPPEKPSVEFMEEMVRLYSVPERRQASG